MKRAETWLAIAFGLAVAVAAYLSIRDVALPPPSAIAREIVEGEPRQGPTDAQPFTTAIRGYTYTITPRATYEIAGLVVSRHRGDAWFNMYHATDPGNIEDVCVVWGEVIANGSYRKVQFWSGEFTCYFSWPGRLDPPFDVEKAANNHLIPADEYVTHRIRNLRVGDQIRMTGLLVDYAVSSGGRTLLTRQTSLTRKDTGNGACETMFVTDLAVVRPGNHLEADAPRYAWYASLGFFVALAAVWLVRPPTA